MKVSIIIVGALALIATASAPAQARVDYYDGLRANARMGQVGTNQRDSQPALKANNSSMLYQTSSGRMIEFSKGSDGRWWPSRSVSDR